MADLQEKWLRFIEHHRLVLPGDGVLIGVSGGKDSVALLDLFVSVRDSWRLRLAAVHLEHGIRGREAERDETFVGRICRQYGIPLVSVQADAPTYCKKNRLSLETGSRNLRYHVFQDARERLGFGRLALAHHADDQAETILLNLVRGAGLRGLGGMRALRGPIIRPLLFATREEIDAYIRRRRLPFRIDSTNSDTHLRRNRMRLKILDGIKRHFGPHTVRTIGRAGMAAAEAEEILDWLASEALSHVQPRHSKDEITLDIHPFLQYFKGVRKAVLIRLFENASFIMRRPGYEELERILNLIEHGESGSAVFIEPSAVAIKSGQCLVLAKRRGEPRSVTVHVGKTVDLRDIGVQFISEYMDWNPGMSIPRDNPDVAFLDGDATKPPFILRFFRQGDWFVPLGMKGKKKLHDFFVDAKIPNVRRRHIPLFVANGSIAWITGLRLDERFKVTKMTRRILKLEIWRH
ncbi:MAG TPA: tRNA lysidine(34) synthetase TilS [bacterium]